MAKPDRRKRSAATAALILLGSTGCATAPYTLGLDRDQHRASAAVPAQDDAVAPASGPDSPPLTATATATPAPSPAAPAPGALTQDDLIRWALDRNPTVRAARFNVQALRHRLPQVTTLEDPVLSSSVFPIPSVAPQYTLMGYMPYSALLAQQFPWFGTLRLRGEAAAEDARVALFELAAAELDVVAGVKSAYHDLRFNERALALLRENQALTRDFVEVAKIRYRTATATQADVLRAEAAAADVDRELEAANQAVVEARSELARLLSSEPEALAALALDDFVETVPQQLERLVQLATVGRPELQGRLAAIARDRKAVELARKKFYPDVTVGAIYQGMERTNATARETAMGMPNLGFFVGFNVPIHHKRNQAGVHEALARANANAQLYEAERDQAHREVRDALISARTQQNVLDLLRRVNLPAVDRIFELTRSEYQSDKPGVDYLTLLNAWRDRLQVELQVAQVEAELGKSLARLERAVGFRLNEEPPTREMLEATPPTDADADPAPGPPADAAPPPAPEATTISPFREPSP